MPGPLIDGDPASEHARVVLAAIAEREAPRSAQAPPPAAPAAVAAAVAEAAAAPAAGAPDSGSDVGDWLLPLTVGAAAGVLALGAFVAFSVRLRQRARVQAAAAVAARAAAAFQVRMSASLFFLLPCPFLSACCPCFAWTRAWRHVCAAVAMLHLKQTDTAPQPQAGECVLHERPASPALPARRAPAAQQQHWHSERTKAENSGTNTRVCAAAA